MELHLHPFDARQKFLANQMGMTCRCSRCLDRSRSERRTKHIAQIHGLPLQEVRPGNILTVAQALRLIALYHEDGVDVFLDVAYGSAALAYNAIGRLEEARAYARQVLETLDLKWEPQEEGTLKWRRFVSNPEQHWSWKLHLG